MAGTLEEFFVSIGVKGQNVVLKNIDKIKKEANKLSKLKPILDMGKGNILKAMASVKSIAGQFFTKELPAQPVNPEQEKEKKQQEKSNNKFQSGVNKFYGGANNILQSSKNFDPVALAQTAITGTGKAAGAIASAIPAVGGYLKDLPPALAEATNSMVSMGVGALEMAKRAASGQWELQSRNATVKYYGGGNVRKEADNIEISRNEYANLMMKVASSNGRLNSSLKEMITDLAKTKDTEQLGNVASGNFASIGTTKGWIAQQMMDSMGNVPPEIRQKMMSALLPQVSEDIMSNKGEGAQKINAKYERQAENQITALYTESTTKKTIESLTSLNEAINKMQVKMFESGVGMATTINEAAKQIGDLAKTIKKAKEEIQSSKYAPEWFKRMFK